MPTWYLIVETKSGEKRIAVGRDEAIALKALGEARQLIGLVHTVTIADRLALNGRDILSIRIQEEDDPGPMLA